MTAICVHLRHLQQNRGNWIAGQIGRGAVARLGSAIPETKIEVTDDALCLLHDCRVIRFETLTQLLAELHQVTVGRLAAPSRNGSDPVG